MNAPFSFVGIADAYIDILSDTGVRTGLELKGNCNEFTPKTDSERKELVGSGRSNFGQTIASVTIPKPMTASIKFNQMDQALFAAAFFGTNSAFTQASGSLTDEPVTTIADRFIEIGKLMIDPATVVVENTAGTVTYAEGDDYIISPRLGMIKALSTGTIPAAASVNVTCDYAAIAGTQMKAMTKSNVRIRIKLDGQNFDDGRNFISEIYQMRLNPSNNFSFVGSDFAEATFEGVLETPSGYNEPMTHLWLS
ncbi:MAG: hypothetical protein KJ630_08125 [Proteobacteria bacterium]|nr:hypothetical protein [Pseudomonadota bacterium]